MERNSVVICNRGCVIYQQGKVKAVIIQPVDDHDLEGLEHEVEWIAGHTKEGFLLAAFKVNDWNHELAPWRAKAVFGKEDFGEGAGETLDFVTKGLIPELKSQYDLKDDVKYIIGGYSLAGLFSLWCAYNTDVFEAVVGASPSVWYPGWMEYIYDKQFKIENLDMVSGDHCNMSVYLKAIYQD